MNILISGCAGFIGSNICNFLVNQHQIVAIDDLSSGNLSNIEHLLSNANFTFINSKIQEFEFLEDAISNADLVIHLAASVGILNIYKNPISTFSNNLTCADYLIELCWKYDKSLIFFSSSEVYGLQSEATLNEKSNSNFEDIINIRNTYSIAKIVDELKINLLQSQGLRCIVLRLFNVIGPNQSANYGMVVPRFINQALNSENISIYGDGSQIRTFTDIRDIVSAINSIMQKNDYQYQVYNLGGSYDISIDYLADMILEQTKSNSKKEYIDYSKIHNQYQEIYYRKPDCSKFENAYNWKAKYDPRQSINFILKSLNKQSNKESNKEYA